MANGQKSLVWDEVDVHDPKQLRSVLGGFLTGVTTVSFRDGGQVRAFTVNSFTSVSLNPPLVMFCVANTASSVKPLMDGREFAISFLSDNQQHISDAFGRPNSSREDIARKEFDGDVPSLRGAMAVLICKAEQTICAGDHAVIIGKVLRVANSSARPLGYLRGQYVIPVALQGEQPGISL